MDMCQIKVSVNMKQWQLMIIAMKKTYWGSNNITE